MATRFEITTEDENHCFSPFDFKRFENIDDASYNDLNKLKDLINDRIEVLWEYTWIDGYIRPSSEEESTEWNKLSQLRILIDMRIVKLEKEQGKQPSRILPPLTW